MVKTHRCKLGREGVVIIKENDNINVNRVVEGSFSETMIGNITFCPFCGINLKEMKG